VLTIVRDFDVADAKVWFPVSFLLVAVIYTGSKSLVRLPHLIVIKLTSSNSSRSQYTRTHTHTKSEQQLTISIFKNLTIILIAYGEVLWFGGSVTGLTLVAFALMVGSSVIAAWADISSTLSTMAADIAVVDPTSGAEVPLPSGVMGSLNAGYLWMAVNCLASAAYVRLSPL